MTWLRALLRWFFAGPSQHSDVPWPPMPFPVPPPATDVHEHPDGRLHEQLATAPGARTAPLTIEIKRFTRVECPLCGRDVAVTSAGITFLHRTRPGTRDFKMHVVRLIDKAEV